MIEDHAEELDIDLDLTDRSLNGFEIKVEYLLE